MTKAQLLEALDGVPDDTPIYVLEESSACHLNLEVTIVDDMDGIVSEIHFNISSC
tara:strand:- start:287 stop:451 length:165 start_codon:yes stop_codon:yes gene_type:complete